ncbi:MAG: DMT family transporter [Planctomycetota bacterium]|nr:DMT family transporter [Planctomycetota bacterium]MDA1261375.1 DMT family transporter [Planctomycetota bacterium]
MTTSAAKPRARIGISTGVACLLLTLLSWSTVPLFLRHLSDHVDFWTNNGWRYGASAIFWMPVIGWTIWRKRLPTGIWIAALIPTIANIFGQVAFTAAFHEMNPGLVTFGLRTQLIWVAIGAYMLVPSERPIILSRRYLFGAFILLAGLFPILLGGDDSLGGFNFKGTTLSILSALGYGMYGLSVRRWMGKYHPVLAFAVICQMTAVGLIALMLVFGRDHGAYVPQLPADILLYLALSAFIGIAIGHILYYISIARIGIVITSGVLQLQPFLVSVASFFFFGETFWWWQWVAGFIAIGGAYLMLTANGSGAKQIAMAASEGSD